MSEQDAPPMVPDDKPERRRMRRRWQVLAGLVFVSLAVPLVLGVALIGREIDAPDWVHDRITARLEQTFDGSSAQVETVAITLGRDLHPRVRMTGLKLISNDLQPILELQEMTALISPRGVLFERSLLLQDVTISGARLVVQRDPDGTVSLRFGTGAALEQVAGLAALLDQIDALLERPNLMAMEQIRASGLIVQYDDARAKRSWTIDGGQVNIDLRGQIRAISGDFSLLSGGASVTRLRVGYQSKAGDPTADISVTVDKVLAADLASQTPALAWLSAIQSPVSGTLRTSLDGNAELGPLAMSIELGAGVVQPNAMTDPLQFDGAKVYMIYDPADASMRFDTFEVQANGVKVKGRGQSWISGVSGALPDTLTAQLALDPVDLPNGPAYPDGQQIPASQIDLRLGFEPFKLELGQFVTTDHGSRLIVSGHAFASVDGWDIAADANVDEISAAQLFALWPRSLRAAERANAMARLKAGTLSELNLVHRRIPNQDPITHAQWGFDGATLVPTAAVPAVTRSAGFVTWDGQRMIVALDKGRMQAKRGGTIDLAGSQITIPEHPSANLVALKLAVRGPLAATMSILSGIGAGGPNLSRAVRQVQGDVDLAMDLRLHGASKGLDYNVSGNLLNINTHQMMPDRPFTARKLGFHADADGLRIEGPTQHQGIPIEIDYRKPASGTARVAAQLALSQRTLEVFGIPLPSGSLTGQSQGRVSLTLVENKPPAYEVTSDLRGLAVSVPSLGWAKPADSVARFAAEGILGERPQVDEISLQASDLVLRGRLEIGPNNQLQTAHFDDLRVGGWFNGPVTLTAQGSRRPFGVETRGGTIDLRKLRSSGGGDGGQGGPMTLALDRVQITDGIAITEFRGAVRSENGLLGDFTGRLNGGPRISGSLVPMNGKTAVRIKSDDAGAVVRAAGLIDTAVGGALELVLQPTGQNGAFDGTLRITSVRLRDAPAIAALLDAVSVVGLLAQLDGNGLAFDEVDARFRLMPDRVIVTQSSAVGPGLGLSLDGIYDLRSKWMDFQGVISPFYLLNGVGSFLTRKGEGLIGFNFNLHGPSDAPAVDVNPLSALTPGMFREIFRRPPPKVTQ